MTYMRTLFLSCTLLYSITTVAQNPQLVKLWETDSTLKVPESVLYHAENKTLYVSNIDGKSAEKDLKGSISKISLDGKNIVSGWIINLSAPKGMGLYNNTLFIADIDEVVVADIKSAKVIQRIPIQGAVFLNDVTVDKKGIVYVSDSRTGKVHRIENKTVSTYIENKMGVNGLLSVDEDLFLAVKDTLFKADKNKTLTVVTTGMDESSDGVVQTAEKDFIVSCWNGVIYYIKADGSKSVLLDTRVEKSNTADIGFDPVNKIIYVPTFFKNTVAAYQLK